MRTTLKDVAKEASVSVATVSLILNNKAQHIRPETIKRVNKAIRKLNYSPNSYARFLQKGKTNLLALLVPDLGNEFYTQVAQGALLCAQEEGFLLTLLNFSQENNAIKELQINLSGGQFAGALVVSRRFDTVLENLVETRDFPIVLLDESINIGHSYNLVTGDNNKGGIIAANYLLDCGHKSFFCILGPQETPNSIRRLSGFIKALNMRGYSLPGDHIFFGDYNLQGGYKAGCEISKLLEREEGPSAIFSLNDLSAIGCIRALKESGYDIPTDVSIMGYDHISIASYLPIQLTSIDQQAAQIGARGIDTLVKKIKGIEPVDKILVEPILFEGESVVNYNRLPEK